MRRHRLDALFIIQVYLGSKFCPSFLEIVGLRVSARYIRDFALFSVCSSCRNCLSTRCASAANVVCRDVDVFGAKNLLLNHIIIICYNCYYYYYYYYYVYVCMLSFSPRNGITIVLVNVLILLFSPDNDNFGFHGIITVVIIIIIISILSLLIFYYHHYTDIINCPVLYFVCVCFFLYLVLAL
jgi:hypothetical protein